MNGTWIKTEDRFPDEDGTYEISNSGRNIEGIAEYNGYGFIYGSVYIEPHYWRTFKSNVKRYGSRNKKDNENE